MCTWDRWFMNKNNSSIQYHLNNEEGFSFFDLWSILLKRKKWIIANVIIALSIAAIYLLRIEPEKIVYVKKTTLLIGNVSNLRKKESEGGGGEGVSSLRLKEEYPFIDKIVFGPGSKKNIMTVYIKSYDKQDAERKTQKVIGELINEDKNFHNNNILVRKKRIEALRKQFDDYSKQLSEFSFLIDKLRDNDPAQASVLVLEKYKLTKELYWLEQLIMDMNVNMSETISNQTKILAENDSVIKPVKPKYILIIIVSIILGAMLGIFSAFIVEFMSRFREQNLSK